MTKQNHVDVNAIYVAVFIRKVPDKNYDKWEYTSDFSVILDLRPNKVSTRNLIY